MNPNRFDDFARQLSGGVSRRGLLAGLAGLAAGAVALGDLDGSLAKRKHKRHHHHQVQTSANCRSIGGPCQTDSDCCAGQNLACTQVGSTGAHRCECASGFTTCGNLCRANCTGGQVFDSNCNCVCPSGTTLCNGRCVATCPDGQVFDSNCNCVCPNASDIFCGGACHNSSECKGNKTINVNCCNRGFNPCQNPGQVNVCH